MVEVPMTVTSREPPPGVGARRAAGHLPHLRLNDFLEDSDQEAVLRWALTRESGFAASGVDYVDPKIDPARARLRISRSLGLDPETRRRIVPRFRESWPAILAAFGMRPFDHVIETEMVAYGDGARFGRHIDTSGIRVRRMVSAVYYFFDRPKRFEGGELLLHPLGAGDPVRIVPEHNMLVAFPSFMPHEVLPVRCPDAFAASRFAINVWVHRAAPPRDEATTG